MLHFQCTLAKDTRTATCRSLRMPNRMQADLKSFLHKLPAHTTHTSKNVCVQCNCWVELVFFFSSLQNKPACMRLTFICLSAFTCQSINLSCSWPTGHRQRHAHECAPIPVYCMTILISEQNFLGILHFKRILINEIVFADIWALLSNFSDCIVNAISSLKSSHCSHWSDLHGDGEMENGKKNIYKNFQ